MRFCHHDRFATLADIVGYYDGITKPGLINLATSDLIEHLKLL
jgi:hypothetical protein